MGNTFCFCSSGSPCQEQNKIPPDIMRQLEEVQSMEKVEELITYIDLLLSNIGTGRQEPVSRPTSVDSGGHLMENFSKRLNRHVCKKCFLSALDRRTRNMVIEVINQAQPIPCVGMALSIIASLLEQAEQVSSNKDQCLQLLRYMSALAKHMKNLDPHLGRPKLDAILCFIVKGTVMCALLMQCNRLCRFIFAALDAADLDNLKLQLLFSYPDLALEAVTQVFNSLPIYPGPSQGEYPHDAVGMEEPKKIVTKLLDLRESSRRVVVIYGVGGIGKTTLATAVFSSLDLTNYSYCRVNMDQDSNDLQAIQQQILRDLFSEYLTLNNCTEGQQKLSEAFGKATKPVFLFMDNALRETDLEKLLPFQHISGLPMHSRILITTRNLKETNIFSREDGIEIHPHRVDSVPEQEAKRILCHHALGDQHGSFDLGVNMEDLLQVCGGIPLVLRIVGSDMRTAGNTLAACNDIIEYHKEWKRKGFGGEEDFSERIVDFVYKRLKEGCQEAFSDIAFYFCDCEKSKVADIVGAMHLRDLEAAALVTTSEEGKVKVHDIVRARGRRLSKGNRIIDTESLSGVLRDRQTLQQTKGIWLRNGYDKISLKAKHVDLMNNYLRVLYIDKHTRLDGQCQRAFPELRFLALSYKDKLPIDLSTASRLVFFQADLIKGHRNSEKKFTINLPSSLRLLRLKAPWDSPVSLDVNGRLTRVIEIELSSITLENFEANIRIGNFSCLKILNIYACSTLERIPESFGNLSCLQTLHMSGCSVLERLPQTFDQLSCLQRLEIDGCERICSFPDNLWQLKCLKFLRITNCKELKTLPDDIVRSTSLVAIKAYGCVKLEAKAMYSLVEIRSLMFLEMGESPMLIKRWEEIQQATPLIALPLRLGRRNEPYEEGLSSMFFSGGSTLLHVDGDGQLADVAFPDVGVEVCLLFTACSLSDELKQKLSEVGSQEFQIIYVDVDMEGEAEGSSWREKREKRTREALVQLPEGSCAWTSHFYNTRLLLAYSLWGFTGRVNTSIVTTRVSVNEEGRRILSETKISRTDSCDSPRVEELKTLFKPIWEAHDWMTSVKKIVLTSDISSEKHKRRALKTIGGIAGVESVAMDMKLNKITVVGDADPVDLVKRLRRISKTEVISVGPASKTSEVISFGPASEEVRR